MVVLDLFSGNGYYTELLHSLVGESGKIIAHTNQADFLHNPKDDHALPMSDKSIRGKTDRFVFKFVRKRL